MAEGYTNTIDYPENYDPFGRNKERDDWCRNCGQKMGSVDHGAYQVGGFSGTFCSFTCFRSANEENTVMRKWGKWDRAAERIETECDHCGETIERPRTDAKGDGNVFCTNRCKAHFHHGEAEQDMGPMWATQRARAMDRDDYECQICGMEQEKCWDRYDTSLHVHHITPRRGFDDLAKANELDNLTTLCPRCHPIEEARDDPLIEVGGESPEHAPT